MRREVQFPDHATLRAASEAHLDGLRAKLSEVEEAERVLAGMSAETGNPELERALDSGAASALSNRRDKITTDIWIVERFIEKSCVASRGLTDCETRCGWTATPGCFMCDL